MMVSLVALFVALGGTATAAKVLITSSSQIKNGTIQRADLAKSAVNSARVKDGSLSVTDLNTSAQDAIEAASTKALEAFRGSGPEGVPADQSSTVATLKNIPEGAYAIFAKTVLTAPENTAGLIGQGQSIGGHCVLEAGGDTDQSYVLLGSPGSNAPGTVSMQLTRTFAGTGSAKITCDVTNENWRASNTSIIALRLGVAPRQDVDG